MVFLEPTGKALPNEKRVMMNRRIVVCLAIVAVGYLQPRSVAAATLSIGAQISIAPNVFVVPINIEGGQSVTSWQFDLLYDSSDVEVYTACDPFSGDSYCSLFTGPVTEGEFFASGSPF